MKYAMADGRMFTNWAPNCDIIKVVQRELDIQDPHLVRQYLQKNAEKIMNQAREKCESQDSMSPLACPVCKNFIQK